MSDVDMTDEAAMWAAVDSGDPIAFGPLDEVEAGRPRFTTQRVPAGYRVWSGDGQHDVTVATQDEAELAALRIVGAIQ